MRSGRLRHQVTLQSQAMLQDSLGGKRQQWVDIATVWAGVEDVTGKPDKYTSDQNYHQTDTQVLIRYRDDVAAGWRVAHKNRYLDVLHVDPSAGRGDQLTLRCRWVKELSQ